MNIRKITSMTMFVSFLFLILTSVILYIVPQGRISYWADWHLWGLTKVEWGNLHVNLGFLFLFAGLVHMYFNWGPIKTYMKNKSRELKVFTPSFNVALLLTLIVGVGTYLEIPPMSTVINLGESIKDKAANKYGEPPYGHAELSSLKVFARNQNLDLDVAMELLGKANMQVAGSSDTLATIAAVNKVSPQAVYAIIKPATVGGETTGTVTFPDTPMSGFGNKTLAAVCSEYNLMLSDIRKGLVQKGIEADAEMTIKEIAAANDKNPMAIFEVLHEIINEKKDI